MPIAPFWKKFWVLLPVVLLGLIYLYDHRALVYRQSSGRRILFLVLSFSVLYGWFLFDAGRRRQKGLAEIGIQGSFYLYVFMVLTLTGYFILFREVSARGWWENMLQRVEERERVNLKPFQIFRIYRLGNKQILGNLIMLLPFGIYLPLLYPSLRRFGAVFGVALMSSLGIELLQLVTRYRSTDVDDVLLNTTGACVGYGLYRLFRRWLPGPPDRSPLGNAAHLMA